MKSLISTALILSSILTFAQDGHGTISPEREANTVPLTEHQVKNLRIETVEPEEITFETTSFAIGRIRAIPNRHAVISTRFSGRVANTPPIVGDRVTKGDILLKVESRQPGSPPPLIDVISPSDGIIFESHVRLGQPVEPAEEMMDIVDLNEVWAVANVPESEASNLKIGSKAHIHIESLGDTEFTGDLIRMGVRADSKSGTVEAIFHLNNPDLVLRPDMRAEFSIVTNTRENVLTVPREAIQGDLSSPHVYVKDSELDFAFVKRPVVLGETNNRHVEIKEGIFPYDDIVTKGAYFIASAKGSGGMSLKEALDLAHGHEHNEDGSEITPEQRAAKEAEKNGITSGGFSWNTPQALFLICANVITLLALAFVVIAKPQAKH